MELRERKKALKSTEFTGEVFFKKKPGDFFFRIWYSEICKRVTNVSWNVTQNYTLL